MLAFNIHNTSARMSTLRFSKCIYHSCAFPSTPCTMKVLVQVMFFCRLNLKCECTIGCKSFREIDVSRQGDFVRRFVRPPAWYQTALKLISFSICWIFDIVPLHSMNHKHKGENSERCAGKVRSRLTLSVFPLPARLWLGQSRFARAKTAHQLSKNHETSRDAASQLRILSTSRSLIIVPFGDFGSGI